MLTNYQVFTEQAMRYQALISRIEKLYYQSGCKDYWWNHRNKLIKLARKNRIQGFVID